MRSRTSTSTMKLLPLLCVCLVSRSGGTFAAGNGPAELIVVEEGADVVLPCSLSSKVDISSALFDWKNVDLKDNKEVFLYNKGDVYKDGRVGQNPQFRGRVSHFPEELKHGNASIIIRNTKVADSGNYTCDFPGLQPRQIFHIELVVGAAPKPYITSLETTKDWSLLQCEVLGASPKPHVEWQDSSGNILPAKEPQVSERGGSYDIILQTTVTKSDHYYCVATQEAINHQIRTETHVFIGGAAPDVYVAGSTGWILGPLLGAVFVTVVVAVCLTVLVKKDYITLNSKRGSTAVPQKDVSHSDQLLDQPGV